MTPYLSARRPENQKRRKAGFGHFGSIQVFDDNDKLLVTFYSNKDWLYH